MGAAANGHLAAGQQPGGLSIVLGCAAFLLLAYTLRRLLLARRAQRAGAPEKAVLLASTEKEATAVTVSASVPIVFVGTGAAAIFAFEYRENGRLVRIGAPVPTGGSPSWLVPDKTSTRVYAVDEAATGGGCLAFATRRDGSPNPLHLLGKVKDPLSPSGPCHCCVDATGRWLLASNYGHGSICVYEITTAGALGRVVDTRSFGTEARPSHAHCGSFSPDNRHAFVCDLGLDGIHQFRFDASTGRLAENAEEPFVHSSPGSGPRHIAWHPRGTAAYTINEKDSTVDTFAYLGPEVGRLRRQQTLPTLPSHFEGESYCAEIKVSPDGRHVYGSNRAVEPARSSVICYAVVEGGGGEEEDRTGNGNAAPRDTVLRQVGWVGESISWPRGMSLSPSGRHLIVANQRGRYGDTIAVFDRDERTGAVPCNAMQRDPSLPLPPSLPPPPSSPFLARC
jgi:6-phosphogluconolactonase